jgi:hypothetical protein
MKAQGSFVLVWLVAGAGAVAGSILGGAFGRAGLFAGAIVGGTVACVLGVALAVRLHWLAPHSRRAASWGAIVGFLVAAPIAVLNLHTPVIPILVCALAGAGALIGAGASKGRAT